MSSWFKQQVRVTDEGLSVATDPVVVGVRSRGLVPIWRGWWLIDIAAGPLRDQAFVEFEVRGATARGQARTFRLPLASARSSKRLVYIPWWIRELAILPARNGAPFDIHRLTVAPALRSFVRRHVQAMLAQVSRDLRGRPLRRLELPGDGIAGARRAARDEALFEAYDGMLEDLIEGGQPLYERWIRSVEPELFVAPLPPDADGPRLSVVMPVHNPPPAALTAAIESVLVQTYPRWQLCIADDASDDPEVLALLAGYAARDARIALVLADTHGHISATTNRALGLADGDFVTFLDHDDELAPQALNEIAAALGARPDLDIVYSDEDFIDPAGNRCAAHFKSDWNPYLLYSHNYVTHLCVYRSELVERAGGMRLGVEGAQDYDLLLRCARLTPAQRILHIPKILYHWRMTESSTASDAGRKSYTHDAGARALRDHFADATPPVRVESAGSDNFYRVVFALPEPAPRVSLLIPTRDQVGYLRTCIDGLLERTDYPDLEILVIDNGSVEAETHAYLDQLRRLPRVRVERVDEPFNFSRLCNHAARLADGELLALLNNDIDVIHGDWLREMASLAVRPDIGCVGAKLLYADDTVQHAGVILGLGGYAAHSHRCQAAHSGGYFNRLKVRQNLSAVTAACLVIRRELYHAVGGMDERLSVAYNDVDFCLRVRDAGYLNLFTPFARLYHFESKTRGYDDAPDKQARFQREKDYLAAKWGDRLRLDPYYNPNLTHAREDFTLGL